MIMSFELKNEHLRKRMEWVADYFDCSLSDLIRVAIEKALDDLDEQKLQGELPRGLTQNQHR
jgi:uncharacterized protein HemX